MDEIGPKSEKLKTKNTSENEPQNYKKKSDFHYFFIDSKFAHFFSENTCQYSVKVEKKVWKKWFF